MSAFLIARDVLPRLRREYHLTRLLPTVQKLEVAIDAGRVRNADYNEAKELFNRVVEDVVDQHQDANHDYANDVMVSGAYRIPAGLKEAVKKNNKSRAELLTALLPLNDLLVAAKPLIVKRVPGELTDKQRAEQAEREAEAMHCQCCGRLIMANTGRIAHHGYERPDSGWQTASCMGALYEPFEQGRERLGAMIKSMQQHRLILIKSRDAAKSEHRDIEVTWTDFSAKRDRYAKAPTVTTSINRANFGAVMSVSSHLESHLRMHSVRDFDELKRREVDKLAVKIGQLVVTIKAEQARYNGWKQTHRFTNNKWETI